MAIVIAASSTQNYIGISENRESTQMLSQALKLRITIGILLAVLLLSATSFKTKLQDVAVLEVNAHLNNLMKSSHSFLLTEPAPIAGEALIERAKEGANE